MFCIGSEAGSYWSVPLDVSAVVGYPRLLTEIVYDCAEITRTIATSSARSPRPSVFCGYFDLVAIT